MEPRYENAAIEENEKEDKTFFIIAFEKNPCCFEIVEDSDEEVEMVVVPAELRVQLYLFIMRHISRLRYAHSRLFSW